MLAFQAQRNSGYYLLLIFEIQFVGIYVYDFYTNPQYSKDISIITIIPVILSILLIHFFQKINKNYGVLILVFFNTVFLIFITVVHFIAVQNSIVISDFTTEIFLIGLVYLLIASIIKYLLPKISISFFKIALSYLSIVLVVMTVFNWSGFIASHNLGKHDILDSVMFDTELKDLDMTKKELYPTDNVISITDDSINNKDSIYLVLIDSKNSFYDSKAIKDYLIQNKKAKGDQILLEKNTRRSLYFYFGKHGFAPSFDFFESFKNDY